MRLFSAVMQGAFRFAVFLKRLMTYNPMQYIKIRQKQENQELFSEDEGSGEIPTITHEQYLALTDFLNKKSNPALLPIQIAYFTGLRIGEVCALTWQDIDLKEQTIIYGGTFPNAAFLIGNRNHLCFRHRWVPPFHEFSRPWRNGRLCTGNEKSRLLFTE